MDPVTPPFILPVWHRYLCRRLYLGPLHHVYSFTPTRPPLAPPALHCTRPVSRAPPLGPDPGASEAADGGPFLQPDHGFLRIGWHLARSGPLPTESGVIGAADGCFSPAGPRVPRIWWYHLAVGATFRSNRPIHWRRGHCPDPTLRRGVPLTSGATGAHGNPTRGLPSRPAFSTLVLEPPVT